MLLPFQGVCTQRQNYPRWHLGLKAGCPFRAHFQTSYLRHRRSSSDDRVETKEEKKEEQKREEERDDDGLGDTGLVLTAGVVAKDKGRWDER